MELLTVAYDEMTDVLTYTVQPLDGWDGSPSVLDAAALTDMAFDEAALFIDFSFGDILNSVGHTATGILNGLGG